MPVYKYKAKDPESRALSGLVEAPTESAAAKLLRDRSLLVIALSETKSLVSMEKFNFLNRVSFGDVVNFTRQLATMIVAGLPLPEALSILRAQTTNAAFSSVLLDIEHQIVGGGNLGDALAKFPQHFSPIYIALIRAGESSGTLDKVLNRLADTLEKQQEFSSKVKGAMIYPVIILVGMLGVMMVMMTVVIPKLTGLYKDFGISLPLTTQILISVSTFMVQFWWLMILGAVGFVAGFTKWKKTAIGERVMDTITLRIPLFGDLTRKIILVEFTRTLAMLLSAGIHIIDGLKILRDALGNVLFRDAIDDIAKQVEKGLPLGEVFAQYAVFPPIISQMIKVGEETGKLDETLSKLSTYFESESEHLVKGLTTAIEPIIMVVLGVGVGFIVISVITPIYNLTGQFK